MITMKSCTCRHCSSEFILITADPNDTETCCPECFRKVRDIHHSMDTDPLCPYSDIGWAIGKLVCDRLKSMDYITGTYEVTEYVLEALPTADIHPGILDELIEDYIWKEREAEMYETWESEYSYTRMS